MSRRETLHMPFSLKVGVSTFVMVCVLMVAGASLTRADNDRFRVRITLNAQSVDAEQVVVQQDNDRLYDDHLQVGIYARASRMDVRQIKLDLAFDHSHVEGASPFAEQQVEYVYGGKDPDWSQARSLRLEEGRMTIVYSLDRAPRKLYVRCREEGHAFTNEYDIATTLIDAAPDTRARNPLYIDAEIEPSAFVNNVILDAACSYHVICTPGANGAMELVVRPTEPTKLFASRMQDNLPLAASSLVDWKLYRDGEENAVLSGKNTRIGEGLRLRVPDPLADIARYRLVMEARADTSSYGGGKVFIGSIDMTLFDASTCVYDIDFAGADIQVPEVGYAQIRMRDVAEPYAIEVRAYGAPLADGRRAVLDGIPGVLTLRSDDETVLRVAHENDGALTRRYRIEAVPDTTAKSGTVTATYAFGDMRIERTLVVYLPAK